MSRQLSREPLEAPLETVVGLEVHLQLATPRKLFCPCANRFGAPPNTLVCPVCLGLPGALPRLRPEAVAPAVRLAVALGCEVEEVSTWARKSYFYPDLAKGYQITQYDRPLARGGTLRADTLRADTSGNGAAEVRLRRLHVEEDAGRLVHLEGASGVDFNRGGVPLVELVTEPEVGGAEAAEELLRGLRALVRTLGVSGGRMEEGQMRCDANVSVRRRGEPLGPKVEVKNLNSFRAVGQAVAAEARRQAECLERGRPVVEETRGLDGGKTVPLRTKEGAADYRYFDEPDLPPLHLSEVLGPRALERARRNLPELPWERRGRYRELGLAPAAASLLAADPELAEWFEAAVEASGLGEEEGARAVAPWVRTEVQGELHGRGQEIAAAPPPGHLGRLVAAVEGGELSQRAAKEVLAEMWDSGEAPDVVVHRLGLAQVSDRGRIAAWVERALAEDAELVERYRGGDRRLLGHFVGRVMALSGGSADPHASRRALLDALDWAGGATDGDASGSDTTDSADGEAAP